MIVVDANIIGYLHLTSPHSELAEQALKQDPHWVAPLLWRSELRNVLALYMRQGLLYLDQALAIMDGAMDLMRDGEYEVASHSVLRLAHQSNRSAYDCEFVALAEDLHIRLVTADARLRTAFPERTVSPEAFCAQSLSPGGR